jgi:1,4-alpha-glucan branching enzyme
MSQVTRIGVEREIELIVERDHANPHHVLGAHPTGDGVVVRAYRPDAVAVRAVPEGGEPVDLDRIHAGGVFEGTVRDGELPLRYRLEVDYADGNSFSLDDPYRFLPSLGELDLYLAGEGRHEELYGRLGSHVRELQGTQGVAFAVWAPAARSVSVVGDFNGWDGRLHPMRSLGSSGIWELFVPELEPGSNYKYEIRAQNGGLLLKVDPYALHTEVPPKNASVVFRPEHEWADEDWLDRRGRTDLWRSPV